MDNQDVALDEVPLEANELAHALARFEFYRLEESGLDLKRAAVCVPVGFVDGALSIALIERASTLRAHPGQWAFPGGRIDEGENAPQAALRELHEELGAVLSPDKILGRLDDFVSRSGYVISPVVVWVCDMAAFRPNPAEVADVFYVSRAHLLTEEIVEWFAIEGSEQPGIRLAIRGAHLFAPAAAIMYQLREVMLGRMTRVGHIEQPMFARR